MTLKILEISTKLVQFPKFLYVKLKAPDEYVASEHPKSTHKKAVTILGLKYKLYLKVSNF